VWTLDPRGDRRTQDALGSLGTVPRDIGRRGDARVGGLRSGGRCYNHPQPLGPRGGEAHWHSAQGAAAWASCRGSPAAGAKRAGQDRRDHWHVEKQQIWVQQTQGTSLADAGDGGSEVYHIVQFEQIDARFGSVENVRQNGIGADQSGKMERVGSRGGDLDGLPDTHSNSATRSAYLVADGALYNADNLQKLADTRLKWITRVPAPLREAQAVL